MSTRITRGIDCGTGISCAHSSGTRSKPRARAATAGNSALRSRVAVKMQLTTFSGVSALRCMISRIRSPVAARMSSASFRSTLVAPRRANSRMARDSFRARLAGAHRPRRGCPQALELCLAQAPVRSRREPVEGERAEANALEREHGMADRLAHPAHLAVPALADRQLDDVRAGGAYAAHARGRRQPVPQLHARAQRAQRARVDRAAAEPGAVGLRHLKARVRQAVGELAVVG